MKQLLNKTVAAIVTEDFKTAPVFEKYGIDFCCKGKKSLESACEEKNIDPATVIEDLELIRTNSSGETEFAKMPLSQLIKHIITVHHRYVHENLRPTLNYLFKIDTKHGERYPYIKTALINFYQVSMELENHMRQEEETVFPLINDIENNKAVSNALNLESLINAMEQEHDTAGTHIDKIKTCTNNYNIPDDACTTFRLTMNLLRDFESDLHRHVHLENYILFPKAIALQKRNNASGTVKMPEDL